MASSSFCPKVEVPSCRSAERAYRDTVQLTDDVVTRRIGAAGGSVTVPNTRAEVRERWLQRVRGIQSWQSGGLRAPHKPQLLLYALGRLQRSGKGAVLFADAVEPLKDL